MYKMLFKILALCGTPLVFAQDCIPVDFGQGSIVCECNSTYCDTYPDPAPPNEGEFIWYVSSKSGKRLSRSDGKISNELKDGYIVRIDSNRQYQTIHGFGGAFTDAAGINIKSLSEKSQENLMRSYFSKDGSKYNLGRIPIGGTDFSTKGYTYDDHDGDHKLEHFALANEDFQYKIPLIKKAQEMNPSLGFLAASWTAPPWMKNRRRFYGFSYLLDDHYQTYADYILKFLEEYEKNGINIWAVSTGNEPSTSLLPIKRINSMFWSPRTMSKWVIENLGPTLERSRFNRTNILMLDDQRFCLPWFPAYIKNNHKDAFKYIKGIAVHWYADGYYPVGALDATHDLLPDKFILITESSIGDRPWDYPKVILGSWSRAELLISKLFENLNHWAVGWVDWNLALNRTGGPTWVENEIDGPIIVLPERDSFYKQPMFYAMAHFSKFIPRSSVRLHTSSENDEILTIAFQTEDEIIVVLLYNQNDQSKNVSIIDGHVGGINVELEGKSLNTFLYHDKRVSQVSQQ
ncbi:hypothetical protein QAD02_019137 [Eretmocerus hayati]|uniref:Uncharacterized protein n=1 Tax=Eretmocerus hayati TaxID=131215 RepID=A0ACC2PIU1_9HYME|nr:hypothetical protein QAD02_019137 [Eretmocerus hayati]